MQALRSVRLVLATILVTAFPASVLALIVPSVVATPPAASAQSSCAFVNTAVGDSPNFFYQLNDTSSPAADSSSNNDPGTISSAEAYDQTPGPASCSAGALEFDGSSTTVTPTSSSATPIGSDLTVMGWFNLSSVPSGSNPRIMANSHTDVDDDGFQLAVNGNSESGTFGTGFFDVGAAGGLGTATWSQPISTGTWYFYAGTYNGSTVSAYLDGSLVASGSTSGSMKAGTASSLGIGYDPAYDGDYFPGQLGDLAAYDSALTSSQIQSLWSAGVSSSWSEPSALDTSSGCGSFASYALPSSTNSATLTVTGAGGGGRSTIDGAAGGTTTVSNFTVNPSATPDLNYEVGCGGTEGEYGYSSTGHSCAESPCSTGGTASGGSGGAGWGAGGTGGNAKVISDGVGIAGNGGGGGTAACLGSSSTTTCATSSSSGEIPVAVAPGGAGSGGENGSGGEGGGGSSASEQWYGESGTSPAGTAQAGSNGTGAGSTGGDGGAVAAGGGANGGGDGTFSSSSGGKGGGGETDNGENLGNEGGGGGGGGYSGGGGGTSLSGNNDNGATSGGGGSAWANTTLGGTTTITGGTGGTGGGSGTSGSSGSVDLSLSGTALSLASVTTQTSGINTSASVTPAITDASPYPGLTCCTWSAVNLPSGISISSSTGVMSGTPTVAGDDSVELVAQGYDASSAYITSTTFSWYVTSVSLSISNQTNGLNTSVAKTFSATESDEGSSATCCTWSASGLPTGLSINPSSGQVSGTPTTAGAFSAHVTATDTAGASATATFTWYITTVSSVTLSNQTTTAGNSVNVTPSDVYNNEGSSATCCTWSATGLPSGLSINTSTGVITGTPTVAGTSSVTLSATDSVGATASTTASWSVVAGPPAYGILTASPPGTATATSLATIPLTLTLEDAYHNVTTPSSPTTVAVTSPSGGFFASSEYGSPTTSITVPANQSSLTVSYADTVTGTPQLVTQISGSSALDQEPITITAANASQLAFVQGPSDATTGQAMSPAPSVQVQDAYGNIVADSGVSVTLFANTGSATSGYQATTDASGLATFSSLVFDQAGTYTLTAGSSGLTGSSPSSSFTVSEAAGPSVTSVSPAYGPPEGGTSVTITGSGFTNTSTVDFGSVPSTSVTYDSPTELTATSPSGTGTVDVTVTTLGETSSTSSADQFAYGPTVEAVSPSTGSADGATSVTITGTNFDPAFSAVEFGTGNFAASVTVDSSTQITATSPAGTGTVDVQVITFGGISQTSAADQFSYQESKPAITAFAVVSYRLNVDESYTMFSTGAPFATWSESGTLPTGLTFQNDGFGEATISGTPTGTGGAWPITVTASNDAGSAEKSISIQVDEAPQFTSSATPPAWTVGVYACFEVTTANSYPSAVTLSAAAFPIAGLTFTDQGNGTAEICGAPTKAKTETATISAKNIVLSSTQSITVVINNS